MSDAVSRLKSADNPANKSAKAYSSSKPVLNATLIILTIVYAFNFIDRQILVSLGPLVKADLSLSDTQLGLLTGIAFALFYTFLGIPIAWLADRSNRRNIVAISLTIWSSMTVVCGFATNFLQLFLARLGVGIGEAGGSPPSHSIISDLYPKHQRATALAIYSAGIYLGIMVGYSFGGIAGQLYGWRTTMMVVGLPGILLAVVLVIFVKEPKRQAEPSNKADEKPGFIEAIKCVSAFPSFWFFALACAFSGFVSYGVGNFYPSWLVRYHDLPLSQVGLTLGILLGGSGIIGTILGGRLTDWLGYKDVRWYLWLPGLSATLGIPFAIAAFNVESFVLAIVLLSIASILGTMYLGPSIATAHRLVPDRMRAMSSAILFFVLNLVGLGLGPFVIGLISDMLTKLNGFESLHLAMTYGVLFALVKALLFYIAGRKLPHDLQKGGGAAAAESRQQ